MPVPAIVSIVPLVLIFRIVPSYSPTYRLPCASTAMEVGRNKAALTTNQRAEDQLIKRNCANQDRSDKLIELGN